MKKTVKIMEHLKVNMKMPGSMCRNDVHGIPEP
jgi:hypothetical protein